MILPIVPYGHPTLRKETEFITAEYPNLKELIDNMYETMYNADGVGLAAPQVDLSIRLVVIAFRPYDEKTDSFTGEEERHTLINPEIVASGDKKDWFNEGCLSIPGIHEDVLRPTEVTIHYFDENWVEHTETIDGMFARVAQHEIDHLDGKVFTDRLSPLRKTMVRGKLSDVANGRFAVRYKMKQNKHR